MQGETAQMLVAPDLFLSISQCSSIDLFSSEYLLCGNSSSSSVEWRRSHLCGVLWRLIENFESSKY